LPADLEVLKQIGACFTSGPLSGVGLRLVGRADPRGSLSYHDALGLRRAQQVASFVEQMGITPDRIEETSRGKREAVGTDEESRAVDRRVDVVEAR
jgi:peptidoglycan-associated lipoprotein